MPGVFTVQPDLPQSPTLLALKQEQIGLGFVSATVSASYPDSTKITQAHSKGSIRMSSSLAWNLKFFILAKNLRNESK